MKDLIKKLKVLANDPELMEVGRKAIEDELIEWRDGRMSQPMRGNGLVIKEFDGTESSIIRFGPEDAVKFALLAISKHLKEARKASEEGKVGE